MPDVTDCEICELLAQCGALLRTDDKVDFQTYVLRILCQIVQNTTPTEEE